MPIKPLEKNETSISQISPAGASRRSVSSENSELATNSCPNNNNNNNSLKKRKNEKKKQVTMIKRKKKHGAGRRKRKRNL